MLLGWLDARRATQIGISLADVFASGAVDTSPGARRERASVAAQWADGLRDFLQQAEREVRAVPLNFYKKAKLANAFKWRLLEKGVPGNTVAEVTQTLVMHLSMSRLSTNAGDPTAATPPLDQPRSAASAAQLLAQGHQCVARGAHAEAIEAYKALLDLKPHDVDALTRLGSCYWKMGRYREAEQQVRHAIRVKPQAPDPHFNLGILLHGQGQLSAAETSFRRALKLEPRQLEARNALGWTLLELGRLLEAKSHFDKALKLSPRHTGASIGLAKIARSEGRFDDAEGLVQRILAIHPQDPGALATLTELRKMTPADHGWLERAEGIVESSAISAMQRTDLRFAIGKYHDDVGNYARAFESFRRGNELIKAKALPYDRQARERVVEALIRSHTRERLARETNHPLDEARASPQPVFVVGMPRSGTSLVEQIIASHPAAAGAGELLFWGRLLNQHEELLRQEPLTEPLRAATAREFLRELARHAKGAQRVVDKTPCNSDILGVIHSVFPNARIIYLQRDPVDSCLSCYFQQFSAALNFATDLSDLAHYYRTHARLMAHWRAVLPADSILEVPYAHLVNEPALWTQRILDFTGLPWDERCLNFQQTRRTVATASAWQVRQKIFKSSLERWRNYETFIAPLLELRRNETRKESVPLRVTERVAS